MDKNYDAYDGGDRGEVMAYRFITLVMKRMISVYVIMALMNEVSKSVNKVESIILSMK